ncbi:hypothetical protein PHET_09965 [Paragonimus heterotremus]|uniref:Uncharacterized protein n=1 Tax=Paragonimus heterotremus TaxID=100268 RepID=A0A8J4SLS5_9TREM|nr:hypothetical protein PHET_09965 [Paragonimus heterotremus]
MRMSRSDLSTEQLTFWSEKHCNSVAFSATVLLAIPEVGESDYYSESPQYLTVADLRELGLYDDDDNDEDDEEEEEEQEQDVVKVKMDVSLHENHSRKQCGTDEEENWSKGQINKTESLTERRAGSHFPQMAQTAADMSESDAISGSFDTSHPKPIISMSASDELVSLISSVAL